MTNREIIEEMYTDDENMLFADGYDDAIIGVDTLKSVVVYSVTRFLELLELEGMTPEEAYEYFEFNVAGAYMGPHTPIWVDEVEW